MPVRELPTTLCESCAHGTTLYGDSAEVYCHMLSRPIRRRVDRCTAFTERTNLPLQVMWEMAWLLRQPRGKSKTPGFVRPGEPEWQRMRGLVPPGANE